ncbi:hypothetical protein F8M41_017158 [Gigaspora margarita]|uniref:Uncharacterized protein n=1 Tax=Gigaspora margarita TaxID=4874 RepID=A0A8H3WVC4_GIGMA|nr:hypothetical protein F8M41_017158 [Gigaspora margarita]
MTRVITSIIIIANVIISLVISSSVCNSLLLLVDIQGILQYCKFLDFLEIDSGLGLDAGLVCICDICSISSGTSIAGLIDYSVDISICAITLGIP